MATLRCGCEGDPTQKQRQGSTLETTTETTYHHPSHAEGHGVCGAVRELVADLADIVDESDLDECCKGRGQGPRRDEAGQEEAPFAAGAKVKRMPAPVIPKRQRQSTRNTHGVEIWSDQERERERARARARERSHVDYHHPTCSTLAQHHIHYI